jgi:hypothetical protein
MISHVLNLDGKGKVQRAKWKIKKEKFCQNKYTIQNGGFSAGKEKVSTQGS